MTILIDLGNELMAEALFQFLVRAGHDHVVTSDKAPANGFIPSLLLVDSTTLSHELLTRYPEAKVLLIDSGIEPEKLPALLLSYRIHGILSPATEIQLLKKALKVVSEGQAWIDNSIITGLLHKLSMTSTREKTWAITGWEQELTAAICQGLTNKEIADRFSLSPHTVKNHLTSIYKKLNITGRSKLMLQAMKGRQAASA